MKLSAHTQPSALSASRGNRPAITLPFAIAAFVSLATLPHSALAADGTWTNDGTSNWSTTSNWADGIVADGAGSLANFSTIDITANRFVTLDGNRTIGGLSFGDANWTNSGFNWNLQSSGGSILTLDNTGGTGGNPPSITIANRSLTISSVLDGTDGLSMDLPWSNYDSTRGTTSAQFGLIMSQTAGTLLFSANNTLSGALAASGGNVRVGGTTGKFGSATALSVTGNGQFFNGDATAANNNSVTNRIGDGTATLSLGGASGAGTFTSAFAAAANTTSQTFASLTVNAGQNVLNTSNTAAGTNDLIFTGTGGAGYVRNTNGLVNIVSATGFNPQFTNAPTALGGSSVSGTGSDAILIGATLDGSNFIAAASGNVGAATYDTTLTAGKNVNVTSALATSGNLSINSLRLGDTTQRTVTIGAADTLTIASGGILLPSSMTTANINHTITGGNLTSGQSDLWIYSASGSTGLNAGNGNPRQPSYSATIASTISGGISLSVGGGTSQLRLTGNNTYTGGTFLQNGWISINADSALGATNGSVTAVSGVNNIQTTSSFSFNSSRNFVINSGAYLGFGDNPAAPTNTIGGKISGGGQLGIGFVSNGQRLVLTGDNSGFTGQYLVNGYLRADEGTGLSSNANLLLNGRVAWGLGFLETSGSFTRSLGSGAGQVQWQNDGGYGSGGFAAVGGALNVNIGGNVTPDTVTWGSGYFLPASGQTLLLGSAASTHDVTFENSIALNGAQRGILVTPSGTTKAIISGELSGNASSGINKLGAGTLVLTGNNTYQGATTVSAGTLQIGDGTTDGSISSSSGITNNAALVYNLIGSQSYNNAIGGTGSLTKAGNGTLTLGGTNTYTGATTVSAGTLLVNGALGNSNVSVSATGIFGGSGTVGGNLGLNSDSFFHVVDLNDPLIVAGTVNLYAGFGVDSLRGLNWGSVADNTYTLIDGTLDTGVFAALANNSLATAYDIGGGRSAYFQEGGLQIVVIPEPRATLLGGLGLLVLLRRRR